jgi:hypothetical protein
MAKTKVLVLGNDPQINTIDFEKLDPSIITLGINRIWLKHIPDYFFFSDLVISNELSRYPEILDKLLHQSTIFSSDWIMKGKSLKNANIPKWVNVYPRKNRSSFPDSVTNSIELFREVCDKPINCTFYLAGVSLTWKEPSHFWKELSIETKNTVGPEWYIPRFKYTLDNFKRLKNCNYDIVSVTPDSKLNGLFRYENIQNLYRNSI